MVINVLLNRLYLVNFDVEIIMTAQKIDVLRHQNELNEKT